MRSLLSPIELQALAPLTLDYVLLPPGITLNALAARLEALGLIETRWANGGFLVRLTRNGFEARGDRLQ